jgi:vacuolar-type H+-ATPase subunit I/STV1
MFTNIKLLTIAGFVAILLVTIAYFHRATLEAGKQQAKLECMQERDREAQLARDKIAELEQNLKDINAASEQKQKDLGKYIKQITDKLKNQPVTVIENGKCVPAIIFIDTINQAVNRANPQ